MTDPGGPLDLASLLDEGLAEAKDEELLDRHAEAVAQVADELGQRRSVDVLAFSVGGERFALDPAVVRQVLESRVVAPLPGAPRQLIGVVLGEDSAVPVLDLRVLLHLENEGVCDLTAVLQLEVAGECFAVAVQTLEGLVSIPEDSVSPASQGPFRWTAGNLALLDAERLVELAAA